MFYLAKLTTNEVTDVAGRLVIQQKGEQKLAFCDGLNFSSKGFEVAILFRDSFEYFNGKSFGEPSDLLFL